MSTLLKYPSTPQFRDVIKRVRDSATYHNVPVPSVTFIGTVKLHGTNAAICYDPATDEMWCQSRENVITPEKDNAGFATWVHGKRDLLIGMVRRIANEGAKPGEIVQLFGEWCGGNIQKSVGINKLPKMFVVFGIRISADAESQDWKSPEYVQSALNGYTNGVDFFSIYDFQTYGIEIDMARPDLKQNELIEFTEQVEKRCPVAHELINGPDDVELVGEGIVWTAVSCTDPIINIEGTRFKVKGEKHSISKVRTLAAVDTEKVANINEFAVNVCTTNRLEQGIDVLKQRGLDCTDIKNIGEFIKWVMQDIIKEELDTIAANNLTAREVQGACINKIKEFYKGQQV